MKNRFPLYQTYRQRLSQSELFRGLTLETLDEMLACFRFESWNKGSIHDSRISLRRFYLVLEGRMELTRMNPATGKQITLSILSEGDMYDVLTLLDGQHHDISPRALDELKLLSAPIDEVRHWIREHPEFNENFMPYLGKRLRDREALVTDLGLYDTHTRLARLVLRYAAADTTGSDENNAVEVTLLHDLSNEMLAHMVGSARQVINRHLQAMKKEGILHTQNRHLIIDDLEKLRHEAEAIQERLNYQ